MSELLPEGIILKVEFEVRLPRPATAEQVEQWLRFEPHDNGRMPGGNPLSGSEVEPWARSFDWDTTGFIGHEERFDVKEVDGGTQYRVRYRRERYIAHRSEFMP